MSGRKVVPNLSTMIQEEEAVLVDQVQAETEFEKLYVLEFNKSLLIE